MSKVVIVTGSARGIGKGIADTFLEKGYRVVYSDKNGDALKTMQRPNGESTTIQCDICVEQDVINLVKEVKEAYGSVDVVVNNAGIQHVSLVEDFPAEMFELVVKVILTGPFLLIKHTMPIMKRNKWGRIINISSVNGIIGFAGKSAYNSAKHGLIGLTKVCALEGALDGVTANAICPSYVDTQMVRGQMEDLSKTRGIPVEKVIDEVLFPLIPQKTLINIRDIAELAVYLCSDSAKNITGQNMVIDAGYTAQ